MKHGQETWTVSRCKRVVRPLLGKIHSLNDIIIKNPALLAPKTTEYQAKDPILLSKLTKPSTAYQRLQALEPFITSELYEIYKDLFQIFKQVIASIEMSQAEKGHRPASLTTISAYDIGKAMMLSTRTSYYKLNQAALFDAETLPSGLREYNNSLAPDIDDWLELEMGSGLVKNYRLDILTGYIIHLVAFNVHILYLLVPVFIHWLYEESVTAGSKNLRHISNKLFGEFWYFNSREYYENVDVCELAELTGLAYTATGSKEMFWWLYNIQYWDKFISSIGLVPRSGSGNEYELLILDTLMMNDKLVDVNQDEDIYKMLMKCPQHLQLNNILMTILTNIITQAKGSTPLKALFARMKQLTGAWIGFTADESTPMLFNSLVPKNPDLFRGLIAFTSYLTSKLQLPNDLTCTLLVMREFFLEGSITKTFKNALESTGDGIVRNLVDIQHPLLRQNLPLKYSNYETNDFIYWLISNGMAPLGSQVFVAFYGDFKRYYDSELNQLQRLLF